MVVLKTSVQKLPVFYESIYYSTISGKLFLKTKL